MTRCTNDHTSKKTMKPFFVGDALAGWYCPVCGDLPEGYNK